MESPKRPETLTLSELAMLYFKDADKRNATRKLSYWFKVNPVLMEKLREVGYSLRQRFFTSKQVAIIFEYFGFPPEYQE